MTEPKRRWIDRHRNPDGGLERDALLAILPYGQDFLLVDRVDQLDDRRIEARYRIPDSSPILRSHFRTFALMPGVLIGEGLAQAGTVLIRQHLADSEKKYLLAMKIEEAKFPSPARPGDTLVYAASLEALGARMARLAGRATVRERVVFEAKLTLAIVSEEQLRLLADSGG